MISQGPEDIEITSGFGPLRPLMDARWEGSTAQNDPQRKSSVRGCCAAQQRYFGCGRLSSSGLGRHMRRRAFLKLVGGAAAWPLAARAQQVAQDMAMPTIGFLGPATAAGFASYIDSFRRGLASTGFVEGRTVAIDYRWANNQLDRLPALAAELVARRVAVIATGSATAAALAAKAATSTIPIVFAIGADPVKFGLVASINRPGGNVTGISFLGNTLVAKQLQLLQGLSPGSTVIGALVNPGNPNAASDSAMVQAAAASLGLQVHVVHTVAERDLDAAFDDIRRAEATAVLVFPDALFVDARARLVEVAARHKRPVLYPDRAIVDAGGLMSYGSSRTDAYREAGLYTGRILRGEKPADLPVIQATKFELVINLKTAKALGLDLPPTLLALADEVIE
jgi:putative ABC transport system substrate-binding protein